jgi:uncharacterized protein
MVLLIPSSLRVAMVVLTTLLAFVGLGIERGTLRPPSWALVAGLAGLAAGVQTGVLAWVGGSDASSLAWRAGVVLVVAPPLARWATRFERHEAGWREAARRGPPDGQAPLALALGAWRLPLALRLLLVPVELPLRLAGLASILLYQLSLSRLMPPACRFEPTCSRYGFGCVLHHGIVRGSLLTSLRLLRCSPISGGGHDPVP